MYGQKQTDIIIGHSFNILPQKNEYVYFYDHEQEQRKIFYKQLNLNIYDVFKKHHDLDIVLNEYHANFHSLPDIEHYFILLYYNIKQSSIIQLQQLWQKLYALFQQNMSQNKPMPMIYINFQNGQNPTNINNVFNIIFELEMDLSTLKDIAKEYYHQFHPKCIKEPPKDIFAEMLNNDQEFKMETVEEEYEEIYGYNAQNFYSMADDLPFPLEPYQYAVSPSPRPTNDGTIFGFFKPKTTVWRSTCFCSSSLRIISIY